VAFRRPGSAELDGKSGRLRQLSPTHPQRWDSPEIMPYLKFNTITTNPENTI
jgi:hypothetical protein